jgi:hypothetical protein
MTERAYGKKPWFSVFYILLFFVDGVQVLASSRPRIENEIDRVRGWNTACVHTYTPGNDIITTIYDILITVL